MSKYILGLITGLFGGAKLFAAPVSVPTEAPPQPTPAAQPTVPAMAIGDDLFLGRFPRSKVARGTKGLHSRSWRNRSPGNLRIRSTKPPVDHIAVDNDGGGPYGIYGTECEGWADLAARVAQLWDGGVTTIGPLKLNPQTDRERGIIWVWAPPADKNNTNAYIDAVCKALGVTPNQPIPNPRDLRIMGVIADTIARVEGLRTDPAWDPEQREAGLRFAGCR